MPDPGVSPDVLAWVTRHARWFVWAHLLAPVPVLYLGAFTGLTDGAAVLIFVGTGLLAAIAVYSTENRRGDPFPFGWVGAVSLIPIAGPLWWLRHHDRGGNPSARTQSTSDNH